VLGALLTAPVVLVGSAVHAAAGPDWVVTTMAGTGDPSFGGDGGPAALASLNEPRDSAVGPDGSLYVTDTFNNRLRRIATDGTISTIAGTDIQGYNGDGIPASEATLSWPHDVAVDADGVIYVADSNNHRIRRIGVDGIITTIAGVGVSGSTGDGGPAVEARIMNPKSVAVHAGVVYIAGLDDKVRAIALDTGVITTIAGSGAQGFGGDGGPALEAQLDTPQRLQVDSTGTVYVADTQNHAIRRIGTDGVITTIAGVGDVVGDDGDGGAATAAHLDSPRGIALDGDATLYIADTENHRIRVVDLKTGVISAVAGTARGYGGDGGPGSAAAFYQPRGLTVLPSGEIVVADTLNNRLRRLTDPAPDVGPVASFSISCAELECALDGSGSSDADGTVTGWTWDFGDGTVGAGPTASHRYDAEGSYTVTLAVIDDDGIVATSTQTVEVAVSAIGPVASIAASCTGLVCGFDGSGSFDGDGVIESWVWDLGDGATATGASVSHAYAMAGIYAVSLTATDDDGLSSTTTRPVKVVVPDVGPVASFSVACTGLVCWFDGSGSNDVDGTVTGWTWDFGDEATASDPSVAHTFAGPSAYRVTLSVVDDDGLVATATQTISVTDGR
jgi:PKD repeat protein